MKTFITVVSILGLLVGIQGCGSDSDDDDDVSCGTVVDISPNGMLNGRLESGDCRLSDLDPIGGDSTFVDEYRVTLSMAGTLTVTMRSSEVDTFLWLLDRSDSCAGGCTAAQAMVITVDDDSGGGVNGTDSTIVFGLAAGSYLILANSFFPESGSYTIETTFF